MDQVNSPIVVANKKCILYQDKEKARIGFDDFIKSNEECFDYLLDGEIKVLYDDATNSLLLIQKDGIIFSYNVYTSSLIQSCGQIGLSVRDVIKNKSNWNVCGVIVGKTIINNGDVNDKWKWSVSPLTEHGEPINSERPNGYRFVTISFDTVANLFGHKMDARLVSEEFLSGRIKILDFCEDDTIYQTAEQRKAMTEHRQLSKMPITAKSVRRMTALEQKFKAPPGYTLTDSDSYHRPATVIVENGASKEVGLFGMDENSYFGVVLPKRTKTIQESYDALIPDEIKESKYSRQGEWFFVPVSQEEQDALNEKAKTLGLPIVNMVTLPLDNPESNPHVLCFGSGLDESETLGSMDAREMESDSDKKEIRIIFNIVRFISYPRKPTKNNPLHVEMYARNFSCYHSDHATFSDDDKDKWFKIMRNLAVRSVSAKRSVD